LRFNASKLLQIAGYERRYLPFDWTEQTFEHERLKGMGKAQGYYVPVVVGIEICKRYGSADLVRLLKENFPLEENNVPIKEIQRQEDDFEKLNFGGYDLLMRKGDHFVNLTHICFAAQKIAGIYTCGKNSAGLR